MILDKSKIKIEGPLSPLAEDRFLSEGHFPRNHLSLLLCIRSGKSLTIFLCMFLFRSLTQGHALVFNLSAAWN